MLDITTFDGIYGNNVTLFAIRTLLRKEAFPKFSIMSGPMGLGKSTVARLAAETLNGGDNPVHVFNMGSSVDMEEVNSQVFKMNPSHTTAFIFEELHGLDKGQQTALLAMFDRQPSNVKVIATTTEIRSILNTIKSRATVWDFKPLSEKQLTQLLDDYLVSKAMELSKSAKATLIKSALGSPRDLLKNTDVAISGEFTTEQLEELLGRVSEDLMFSLLCSLKSQSVDFVSNISAFIDSLGSNKLGQLRDFFTRFILERRNLEGSTISKEKIRTLESTLTAEEIEMIGRTLVRAKPDTLVLELSLLNMEITRTSTKQLIGQQVDKVSKNTAAAASSAAAANAAGRMDSARVSARSLQNLKFSERECN